MQHLASIRRQPWIGDFNLLVETINKLIDIVNRKKEVVPITIERQVKDYSFFHWEEVSIPYETSLILMTPEDAASVFWKFALTYKETAQINNVILEGNIVSLEVKITEEISEKDKRQEIIFEDAESTIIQQPTGEKKKKRGRKPKKRTSWE